MRRWLAGLHVYLCTQGPALIVREGARIASHAGYQSRAGRPAQISPRQAGQPTCESTSRW